MEVVGDFIDNFNIYRQSIDILGNLLKAKYIAKISASRHFQEQKQAALAFECCASLPHLVFLVDLRMRALWM
ncbi:hypothetical protein FGO68_gene11150 [Halteria grandinella]|uniref:Uncharacterized protein n=1 Tax=Halteria grandinella TaxID=5974 RepID=A0A8J8N9E3_HALGN|nr:hypothetical protein FGO68_gene11150 [Halteria grandinella]